MRDAQQACNQCLTNRLSQAYNEQQEKSVLARRRRQRTVLLGAVCLALFVCPEKDNGKVQHLQQGASNVGGY